MALASHAEPKVHTDVFFIVSSYLIAKRPKGAPQEAAVRVALNVPC